MELTFGLLALFASLAAVLAQQEPQIAPQATQHTPQGRSAPLLGVRYSAATDVSHVSFNSPLVTYGSSLNEIQLPAAPIQPVNLRQAPKDDNSRGANHGEQGQTLVRSFGNAAQPQAIQPQNPAAHSQVPTNQQQFISVQQYPARPQLQSTPQGFSLSQNLPGPQPQATSRYAPQFSSVQGQPQIQQPQYATPQIQQPQYATPQIQQPQYATPQPQAQQYPLTQPQYATAQPLQYPLPQPQQYASPQSQEPQIQYPNPVTYSSPSYNAFLATGPFAAQYPASNLIARQYPAQLPVAPQYEQPLAPQFAQPAAPQYAQPVAPTQYAGPSSLPAGYSSAPAQFVSRVAFSGPVGAFSYGF